MDLHIYAIHNHGDQTQEYVLLEVRNDCNLHNYQIVDSTYTSHGELSNRLRHLYWFPDKRVKKGEFVCLRTKKGNYSLGSTTTSEPMHQFYWGLNEGVWNDEGDNAVLQQIVKIQPYKVDK